MELPSVRELELETLLREKDAQLAEVTDEITVLRQYLSKQPGPSTAEPVTLPPALVSVLMPHIKTAGGTAAEGASSSATAALIQKSRALQEENDELYELLKTSETGRLKDEVRGLRRVVAKLEGALKESHKAIVSLSTELDKAYETIMANSRQITQSRKSDSHSHSPRHSLSGGPYAESAGNGSSTHKPPPTEPRAHKRPRLSEPQPSPPVSQPQRLAPPSLPQKPQVYHHSGGANGPSRTDHGREHGRHSGAAHDGGGGREGRSGGGGGGAKMDVDVPNGRTGTPPTRERDRPRERERNNRDRERDRERGAGGKERERPRDSGGRDWDRDGNKNAHSRRNGHSGAAGSSGRGSGSGGGSGRNKGGERNNGHNSNSNANSHADSRTLQERLGL